MIRATATTISRLTPNNARLISVPPTRVASAGPPITHRAMNARRDKGNQEVNHVERAGAATSGGSEGKLEAPVHEWRTAAGSENQQAEQGQENQNRDQIFAPA